MDKDLIGALSLVGIFVLLMGTKTQFQSLLNQLMYYKEFSTLVLLGGNAFLYVKGYHKTAFIGGLLSVYLIKTLWVNWPRSYQSQLYIDISRDNARFDPLTSIDLQFANRTVQHNLPVLLVRPEDPELLVFPPSTDDLKEMSG
jgi:hypothetical protein